MSERPYKTHRVLNMYSVLAEASAGALHQAKTTEECRYYNLLISMCSLLSVWRPI